MLCSIAHRSDPTELNSDSSVSVEYDSTVHLTVDQLRAVEQHGVRYVQSYPMKGKSGLHYGTAVVKFTAQ